MFERIHTCRLHIEGAVKTKSFCSAQVWPRARNQKLENPDPGMTLILRLCVYLGIIVTFGTFKIQICIEHTMRSVSEFRRNLLFQIFFKFEGWWRRLNVLIFNRVIKLVSSAQFSTVLSSRNKFLRQLSFASKLKQNRTRLWRLWHETTVKIIQIYQNIWIKISWNHDV